MKKCWSEMYQFELTDPVHTYYIAYLVILPLLFYFSEHILDFDQSFDLPTKTFPDPVSVIIKGLNSKSQTTDGLPYIFRAGLRFPIWS